MLQRIDYAALAKRVLATGYTTRRLGSEIGLSQPSVSRLANGRTKAISADAGIALIYLVGGHVHLPATSVAVDSSAADGAAESPGHALTA